MLKIFVYKITTLWYYLHLMAGLHTAMPWSNAIEFYCGNLRIEPISLSSVLLV
jgi:hypothetical protein